MLYHLHNMKLLDPRWDEPRGGYHVIVEDQKIREVSPSPLSSPSATTIDCGGRTLMPGLIDCHVHVFIVELSMGKLETYPLTLMTAKATKLLKAMLDRGFTTVRDTGGADWGIRQAVEDGTIDGPRLFVSIHGLSS